LRSTRGPIVSSARIFSGHAAKEPLIIKHGITADEIADSVYGFQTFSADIKSTL
jgi:hypothetical protein